MRVSLISLGMAIGVLTSCATLSGTTEAPTQVVLGPVETGVLPDPLSGEVELPVPPSTAPTTTVATAPIDRLDGLVADAVTGNRILVIGDTVLAATAPRNDGGTCRVLVDFGWQVEMDTEPGRFIEFGADVIDARLRPDDDLDWDVIVIMLGNHFDGDVDAYSTKLDLLLDSLAPRPVVIYTVSELQDGQDEINDFIRSRVRFHSNIVIIDWAEASAAEPDLLLRDGGPAPTTEGAKRLSLFLAAALGKPDGDPPGECLDPAFTDDSAILL